MKQTLISIAFIVVLALGFVRALPDQDAEHPSLRKLASTLDTTSIYNTCKSSEFSTGSVLYPGEAICQDDVQMGIFSFQQGNGDVTYKLQIRENSELIKELGSPLTVTPNNSDRIFLGMVMQHDANLILFNREGISNCLVLPGRHSNDNRLTIRVENGGAIALVILDKENDVVWRYLVRESNSIDSADEEAFGCYPDLEDICHFSLTVGQRISWKEFLCVYDAKGDTKYKYGLDKTGSLGLYYYDQLVYRPRNDPEWIRGDYLHFQHDGHLTLYKVIGSNVGYDGDKKYVWTSECIDTMARKLIMTTDGDVQKLTDTSLVWLLKGSGHPEPPVVDARDSVPEVCNADPI
jgi:hypothetical protein